MWRRHHGIQKDRDIEIDEPETPGPAASNASTESASKGVSEGATAVEQEGARVRVEGEQRSSCLPGACQWFVLTGSA